jgi:hypothetical protein
MFLPVLSPISKILIDLSMNTKSFWIPLVSNSAFFVFLATAIFKIFKGLLIICYRYGNVVIKAESNYQHQQTANVLSPDLIAALCQECIAKTFLIILFTSPRLMNNST